MQYTTNELTELLKSKNNTIWVESTTVGEKFGKSHNHVVRDIEEIINKSDCPDLDSEMFLETTYVNSRGKTYKSYLMNRDGFSLLAMGFTGKEAFQWKLKFINAFNLMEEKLKQSNVLSEEERLKLQLFSKDASEVAYAHNRLIELATAPLIQQIEEDKPLVDFANQVSDTTSLIDMNQMAKLLKDEHIPIGRNRLYEILRQKEILRNNNEPYQKYIESGYFRMKEGTYDTPYGTKTYIKTMITGKGQIWITEKLRKEFCNVA